MTVADLDLVTVYCDGDTDLISLACGEVLACDVDEVADGTPHFDMYDNGHDHERDICLWAGLDPDDGIPGGGPVAAHLKTNRHLLK